MSKISKQKSRLSALLSTTFITAFVATEASAATLQGLNFGRASDLGSQCRIIYTTTATYTTNDGGGGDRVSYRILNQAKQVLGTGSTSLPGGTFRFGLSMAVDINATQVSRGDGLTFQSLESPVNRVLGSATIPLNRLTSPNCKRVVDKINGVNTPPVANAGPDKVSDVNDTVTLDFNGSSDPDGDTWTVYRLNHISGPLFNARRTSNNIYDVVARDPSSILNGEQTVMQLVVRDSNGATSADNVAITWQAPNRAPTANAGPDISSEINTGVKAARVRLDGTQSSDPEGQALTYNWQVISGVPVSILGPDRATPDVQIPSTAGTTTIRLTVTDPDGATSSDDVVLTWTQPNRAPVADAGADQSLFADFGTGTSQTVSLDGRGSSDPDGDGFTYAWTQISGPATQIVSGSTTATPVYRQPSSAGTVVYRLTVTDPDGLTSTDTMSVIWNANSAPVTNTPAQQPAMNVVPGSTFRLRAGDVTTTSGNSVTYMWRQTGGPSVTLSDSTAANPTFTVPNQDGTLTFELVLDDGISQSKTLITVVMTIDQAPTANAGPDQLLENVASGTRVTLDGTNSTDPEGGALTYNWVQISGPRVSLRGANTATPSFIYPNATKVDAARAKLVGQPQETLVFGLTVSDGNSTSAQDQVEVKININAGPTAVATASQTTFYGLQNGDTVSLDGSGSSDPDGDTLTYSWTQTSGRTLSISGANTATPTITYDGKGTTATPDKATFSLTVSDGAQTSASSSVELTFIANRAPIANAGSDISGINAGETVTLNAGSSSDPDGDTLSYSWRQLSGSSVSLSGANTATPSFTAPDVASTQTLVFEVTVDDGKGFTAADQVRVQVQPTGSITIIQQSVGGDISYSFTSTLSDLTGSVLTANGVGQLVAAKVNTGVYTVTGADRKADGYALTGLVCDDRDSVVNLSTRTATVNLSPGEDVTCTFTSTNSRGAAHKAIRQMMVQRGALVLANQPSLQRRVNRLKGNASGRSGVNVAGFELPGSGKLPLLASMDETGAAVAASLAQARGEKSRTGKGSVDVWVEGTYANVDVGAKDGNFGIVYGGVDYMASENLLVGAMVQYDSLELDGGASQAGDALGQGFMVGPYATAKIKDGLYVDGRVAFGSSSNKVNPLGTFRDKFDGSRVLLSGSVTGEFKPQDGVTISPTVSLRHYGEKQKAYVDSLGVTVNESRTEMTEFSFAPRLERFVPLQSGWTVNPYAQVEGIYSFGDDVGEVLGSDVRARIEGGAMWSSPSGVRAGISAFADGLGADQFAAQGIRVSFGYTMK